MHLTSRSRGPANQNKANPKFQVLVTAEKKSAKWLSPEPREPVCRALFTKNELGPTSRSYYMARCFQWPWNIA